MPSRLSLPRLAVSLIACLAFAAAPIIGRGEMVYVTSLTTGELGRFNSENPGSYAPLVNIGSSPTGLAFGPDGKLYIAVSAIYGGTPSIARYDVVADVLETGLYDFADTFRPTSIAFKGNDLLVGSNPLAAFTGPIVQLANIVGGSPPMRSDYTTGGSLVSSPGLALDGSGNLYVSNQTLTYVPVPGYFIASGPVERFDATGSYVNQVVADGASTLAGPTGLVVNGNTLYTASIMNGRILATDLTTDITSVFADTLTPFATGSLAQLSNGNLLAGDASGTNPFEIYRFANDGSLIGSYDLGLGQVGGITVAPVPEPGTLALVGIGLVTGVALLRRRRRATMSA